MTVSPYRTSNIDPGNDLVAVGSGSDANDIRADHYPTIALLVGVAGAAKLTMANDRVVDGVPLQQGYNPLRVKKVWATGLGASGIFGIY